MSRFFLALALIAGLLTLATADRKVRSGIPSPDGEARSNSSEPELTIIEAEQEEEELQFSQFTIDKAELELMRHKVALRKKRLEHLQAKLAESDCSDEAMPMTEIEALASEYDKTEKSFVRKTQQADKAFSTALSRSVLNSLKLRNTPFMERQYVFPEDGSLEFVHYEYMHIRMKAQSTKFKRVSPTTNSIPKYVIVVIYSNNQLVIYDTSIRTQKVLSNRPVLMSLNLTEEGISSSPEEIIALNTAKTPANSYKKDNQDLKSDDRPYFHLTLRDGRTYHYRLSVIDKFTGLSAYRRNHQNDTRYIYPNQTRNYYRNKTEGVRHDYVGPEIRIDQITTRDLTEIIFTNSTLSFTDEQTANLEFTQADYVTFKGRKYLVVVDNLGFANYFSTKLLRSFFFQGRVPLGGVQPSQLTQTFEKPPRAIGQVFHYGVQGYFTVFSNHFIYLRHFQRYDDSTFICMPGLTIEGEGSQLQAISTQISQIMPDTQLQGLVYAVSEAGDSIMLFQIDLKAASRASKADPSSLEVSARKAKKQGFSSTSDCQMIGHLKVPLSSTGERILQIQSVKNQLVIHSSFGRMYSMETSSIEDILLNPYIEEIKPSLSKNFGDSTMGSKKDEGSNEEVFTEPREFRQVKKSKAEMNSEKGSHNLLLLPYRHSNFLVDGKPATALISLDYTPTQSRAKLRQEIEFIKKREAKESGLIEALVDKIVQLTNKAGQFGLFEEGSEAGDQKANNPYKFLNYILGIVTFCLVVYFMMLIRGKKDNNTGSSRRSGRKAGGMAPLGANRSSGGGGLFGTKRAQRSGGGLGAIGGRRR